MLIEAFATHVSGLEYDDIPAPVVADAKRVLLDTQGIAIRGTTTEHGRIATRYADAEPGTEAPLLGGGRASVANTAFANGVCAHAIDFDDVYFHAHPETSVHPAASIVSATIAAASELDADGRAVVTALVAGYDVVGRMTGLVTPAIRHNGYHPTSVMNGIGTAAALASIYGLSRESTKNAIAIATDQSSGTGAYRHVDSMMKHFHAGHPAADAVMATKLADAGFVGAESAIDGTEGFLETLDDNDEIEARVETVTVDLGDQFEISRTNHKPYPACTHTHAPNDVAMTIRESADRPIDPDEIESIRIETYHHAAGRYNSLSPDSMVGAMFSIPYTVIATVLTGTVTLDQYEDEFYADPVVRDLLSKTEIVGSDACSAKYPDARPCRIVVEFTDGDRAIASTDHPRGSREKPLTDAEVEAKFTRLTASLIAEDRARDYIETVRSIEGLHGETLARELCAIPMAP